MEAVGGVGQAGRVPVFFGKLDRFGMGERVGPVFQIRLEKTFPSATMLPGRIITII